VAVRQKLRFLSVLGNVLHFRYDALALLGLLGGYHLRRMSERSGVLSMLRSIASDTPGAALDEPGDGPYGAARRSKRSGDRPAAAAWRAKYFYYDA